MALRVGAQEGTPALTVNRSENPKRFAFLHMFFHVLNTWFKFSRLCGSGFQSVVNGAQEILLGDSEIVLAAGADNMSAAPYALRFVERA